MKLDPNRLREHRNDKGLKQEALAQDVGCDLRTIQLAEAGENIKRHTALRISQVLDVPINRLSVPEMENRVEDEQKSLNRAGTVVGKGAIRQKIKTKYAIYVTWVQTRSIS